jgi:hypothetical protein
VQSIPTEFLIALDELDRGELLDLDDALADDE